MFQEASIIERHARRTLDDVIRGAVYSDRVPVDATRLDLDGEPEPFDEICHRPFSPIEPGTNWGRPWGTTWFHLQAAVPEALAGLRVELMCDIGFHPGLVGFHTEATMYGADGTLLHGLHPLRRWHPVATSAVAGTPVEVFVEAAANPMVIGHHPTPFGDPQTAGDLPIYTFRGAWLAAFNVDVWHLELELEFMLKQLHNVPKDGPHRPQILAALSASMANLDANSVADSAAEARRPLQALLAEPGAPRRHLSTAIGHAHIDTAWLWPIRETRRKCIRTFANQIDLFADYPEHRFGCSQAAQYEMVEGDAPALFERIRAEVRQGRWVPLGGCWVEADGNLPGGESLVRQHLYGQRYFEEKLGQRCTVGWIPDVFGYPASLPQIMRQAGLTHFVTQKLSWNRTNVFPHHTFLWEGLDGSVIPTHFPPSDTYNCEIDPYELSKVTRSFKDHGWSRHSLLIYGHGDGGGGPTREMLERLRFSADTDGIVRQRTGSPAQFFAEVDGEIAATSSVDLPRWRGELYFEMHRGTYTSQAKTKAGNRAAENLLREAEWLCVMAAGVDPEGGYPSERLERLWKDVLILQFHDILPGSSIAWVHQQAEGEFGRIRDELTQIIEGAVSRLTVPSEGTVWFNPAPFEVAAILGGEGWGPAWGPAWVEAPAGGFGRRVDPPASVRPLAVDGTAEAGTISNGILEFSWDRRGLITSIVHLDSGRQTLQPGGSANRLEAFEDRPIEYDAWDIEPYYRHRGTVIDSVESVELAVEEIEGWGPASAHLVVTRSFGNSRIRQRIGLRAGAARIDIDTDIDWQESNVMLKAAFDVAVRTDTASAEVQFGHVERPTAVNTSWDLARFEVCAHRWIDVSEPDFGVALLNDSKYGHDTLDGHLRITLLRSPEFPDPHADRGQHRFTYSVMPHAGDLAHSEVVAEGYRLNLAPRRLEGRSPDAAAEPVAVADHPGLVIETAKLAEDGTGDLVLRCYESRGAHTQARLALGRAAASATVVNLLEEPFEASETPPGRVLLMRDGRTVEVEIRPFGILTIRLAATQGQAG
jgi:alpha-mannosidase